MGLLHSMETNTCLCSNAEKHLGGNVRSFLKDMKQQTGAILFVMGAYKKAGGKPVITR
jgi:hypothetical protein